MNKLLRKYIDFSFLLFVFLFCIRYNRTLPFREIISVYFCSPIIELLPFNIINNIFFDFKEFYTELNNGISDTLSELIIQVTLLLVSLSVPILLLTIKYFRDRNYLPIAILLIKYYLAFTLTYYGLAKMFSQQFLQFDLQTLNTTFGDASPMNLAWAFYGYSYYYQFFIGLVEVSSILILFKRTERLGTIITFIVTLNIVTINYFFNIPMKLMASYLFIFSIVLVINNWSKLKPILFDVAEEFSSCKVLFCSKNNKRLMKIILKYLLITYYLINTIYHLNNMRVLSEIYTKNRPKMYGIYNVYDKNIDSLLNTIVDKNDWKQLIIEYENYVTIKNKDNSLYNYDFTFDSINHTIILSNDEIGLGLYLKLPKLILTHFYC